MSEWISVKDELPDVFIDSKGHCNVVLVKWAIKIECGSQYQTSNTAYVNKYPEKFTHWMPLPEPPSKDYEYPPMKPDDGFRATVSDD